MQPDDESELTRFRHGERVSDLDNNGQCNRCGNIVAKYGHEPWCVNGLYEAERDALASQVTRYRSQVDVAQADAARYRAALENIEAESFEMFAVTVAADALHPESEGKKP